MTNNKFQNYIDILQNKKIAILGFGVENQALAEWLIDHDVKNITICDKNEKLKVESEKLKVKVDSLKFQFGERYFEGLEEFDVVFRTPGLSVETKELIEAKENGVEISSQIKLFFDLCPAKIIGVTGTKGKGTTASLIFSILKRNFQFPISNFQSNSKFQNSKSLKAMPTGRQTNSQQLNSSKIYLAGNIGNAPIEFVDKLTKNDIVVLELSSFQLEDIKKSPNIAVVLDIKEDHLNYHGTREKYVEAKKNIVRFQKENDVAVVNLDYLTSFEFAALSGTKNIYYFSRVKSVDQGVFIDEGDVVLRDKDKDEIICKTKEIALRGEHNLENIAAAIAASYLAGADIETKRKTVKEFKGLEHRLEFICEKNKVKFYNDSFSTTPDTAIAAIKSFSEPIILIVGGSEKGADYGELAEVIANSSVKAIIAIGVTGKRIAEELRIKNKELCIIEGCKNMQEIMEAVRKEAKFGDVVLLSPASASFGMFKNYKDRGKQFKEELRIKN